MSNKFNKNTILKFLNDYKNIFEKKSSGTFFSRILNQIIMIFNSFGSDGGLFVLIGKKNDLD